MSPSCFSGQRLTPDTQGTGANRKMKFKWLSLQKRLLATDGLTQQADLPDHSSFCSFTFNILAASPRLVEMSASTETSVSSVQRLTYPRLVPGEQVLPLPLLAPGPWVSSVLTR